MNTEPCWDDYQIYYPSEPYSEEVVDGRNLMECDDFGQWLPSDTWRGPPRRRRVRQPRPQRLESTDTESEPEEVISLIERSLSQLREVEAIFYGSSFTICHVSFF